jgi:integrase
MPKLIATMPVKAIDKLGTGKHAVAPFLYLYRKPTGGASWLYRYVANGSKIDMGIGSLRDVSRDDAIAKVAELQALRKAKIDPRAARRETAKPVATVPTFKAAALAYHATQAAGWSKSHAAAWIAEMEREAFPAIGALPINRVGVEDVLRALVGWAERHETSSRVRGRIEKTLDWAKVKGYRTGENPAIWRGNLENLLAAPKMLKKAKGEQHHAAMPWDQVPAFVAQLPDIDAARALRFCILTAARSAEVRDAAWSEINMEAATWTVPASRMKGRREHVVALSGPALAVLKGLHQETSQKEDFIFQIARDDMAALMPENATVHGMRAAFSTWAGDLGIARDVVERCLAHLVGSSTERAYRRGAEVEQMRAVMERWAAFVSDGEKQNVVVLDAKRA